MTGTVSDFDNRHYITREEITGIAIVYLILAISFAMFYASSQSVKNNGMIINGLAFVAIILYGGFLIVQSNVKDVQEEYEIEFPFGVIGIVGGVALISTLAFAFYKQTIKSQVYSTFMSSYPGMKYVSDSLDGKGVLSFTVLHVLVTTIFTILISIPFVSDSYTVDCPETASKCYKWTDLLGRRRDVQTPKVVAQLKPKPGMTSGFKSADPEEYEGDENLFP